MWAPQLFVYLPVFPPSCDAPAIRQERQYAPTRRAGPPKCGQLQKRYQMHLRIKAFYGTSENAVKAQIWIAIRVYVLVAIVSQRLGLEDSLYQILQILSLTLFEKMPSLQALQEMSCNNDLSNVCNQLNLFDL
jgi:hypothetical protein